MKALIISADDYEDTELLVSYYRGRGKINVEYHRGYDLGHSTQG